jgi:23S rRNA (guanine745-N1)-methyltransferase
LTDTEHNGIILKNELPLTMQLNTNLKSIYHCPLCQSPLDIEQQRALCSNGHSYDVHKKGYLNLLLAHKKNSKAPGDDALMVASRRRFLGNGLYQPLAQAIANRAKQWLPQTATVWDAGCGEGYYTSILAQTNPEFSIYGLDISKPAIQAACRFKNINWCVASSAHPPYLDESFDAIVSVFSRVDALPFHRVLKADGSILMAVPDTDHLLNLRHLIYDTVRPYETTKHLSYFSEGFYLENEQRITVELELDSTETIFDLLGMTPHAHRLPNDKRRALEQVQTLTDTACFKLYHFKKSHQNQDQTN